MLVFVFVCIYARVILIRIAALDVGDGIPDKLTFKVVFLILAYQWYNAIVFFMPSFVGDAFLRFVMKLFKAPLFKQGRAATADVRMNYQYFYFWLRILFGSIFYKLLKISQIPKIGKVPSVPTYFAYGERNPIKFHTKNKWGKEIMRRNKVQGYEGCYIYGGYDCDHWLQYAKPSEFGKLIDALKQWLKRTDGKNIYYDSKKEKAKGQTSQTAKL